MSDSAKFFKRQSGQMDAVVAEAIEILEATKEIVTRLESGIPPALSAPPTAGEAEIDIVVDTGRYSLLSPTGSLLPPPAPPKAPTVLSRPVAPKKAQVQAQAPRQQFRPLPPPKPEVAGSTVPQQKLGRTLTTLREVRRERIEDTSLRTGIPAEALRLFESGRSTPTRDNLRTLASHFGANEAALLRAFGYS